MRIRSTKPEFWRSETIAALTWEARLILKGIESYVDDNGVGKDSEVLICADVFPHDLARNPDTLARVSRGLQELCDASLVARYTMAGERLIYVRNWKKLQRVDRPNKGRHPRPDGTLEYSEDVDESVCAGLGAAPSGDSRDPRDTFATPSRESRDTPLTGTGEQGNRGTGEKEISSSAKPPTSTEARPDVEALCTRLRDRIVENGNKAPTITSKWQTEARLLLDKDGRDLDKSLRLIDWCQQDSFWHRNILSMPKFREKYDQLRMNANAAYQSAAQAGGPSKKEMAIAQAELLKENPDRELLRRAGLDAGPTVELRAIAGGLA